VHALPLHMPLYKCSTRGSHLQQSVFYCCISTVFVHLNFRKYLFWVDLCIPAMPRIIPVIHNWFRVNQQETHDQEVLLNILVSPKVTKRGSYSPYYYIHGHLATGMQKFTKLYIVKNLQNIYFCDINQARNELFGFAEGRAILTASIASSYDNPFSFIRK
jgi:hypothetical protein